MSRLVTEQERRRRQRAAAAARRETPTNAESIRRRLRKKRRAERSREQEDGVDKETLLYNTINQLEPNVSHEFMVQFQNLVRKELENELSDEEYSSEEEKAEFVQLTIVVDDVVMTVDVDPYMSLMYILRNNLERRQYNNRYVYDMIGDTPNTELDVSKNLVNLNLQDRIPLKIILLEEIKRNSQSLSFVAIHVYAEGEINPHVIILDKEIFFMGAMGIYEIKNALAAYTLQQIFSAYNEGRAGNDNYENFLDYSTKYVYVRNDQGEILYPINPDNQWASEINEEGLLQLFLSENKTLLGQSQNRPLPQLLQFKKALKF